MDRELFSRGLGRGEFVLLCLIGFFAITYQELGTHENKEINEKLKNDEWFVISFDENKTVNSTALQEDKFCEGLNDCQVDSWKIVLNEENALSAIEIANLTIGDGWIEDANALVSHINNSTVCEGQKVKSPAIGRFYIFCQKPLSGNVVEVKIRRKPLKGQAVLTAIELYAEKNKFTYDHEIPLSNKYVTQIGNFKYFIADFAADDNRKTEAVACFPCNGKTDFGFGWWQVDLDSPTSVTRLEIFPSENNYYANTLEQTIVGVGKINSTDEGKFTKCGDVKYNNSIVPHGKITLVCKNPIIGRYVTIKRSKNATFRPDLLVLTEVKVYEKQDVYSEWLPEIPMVDPKLLRKKLLSNEWELVLLHGVETKQSGSDSTNGPELAVDDDPNTHSVACANCNKTVDELGWWSLTLGSNHDIVAVEILGPRSNLESNYLREFEVLVVNENITENCAEFRNRAMIPQGAQILLVCNETLKGNRIVVRRLEDSKFAPEKISIAEINVFSVKKYPGKPQAYDFTKAPLGHPIYLGDKNTDQRGTHSFYLPDFAVDGNPDTCSISCLSCEGRNSSGSVWWKVDLGRNRLISGVQIFPCSDEDDAHHLKDIRIGVSASQESNSTYTRCGEIKTEFKILPASWLTVMCDKDVLGRFLIIERISSAHHKADSIAMAEVQIYVKDGSLQEDSAPKVSERVADFTSFNRKVKNRLWFVTYGNGASQSDTQSSFGPDLAIDGDILTYSVACDPCSDTKKPGVAWWAVHFDMEFKLTAVAITSSPIRSESNYLQEFRVKVGGAKNHEGVICAEYVNRTLINVGTKIYLLCNSPSLGNTIMIERLPKSKFRKDKLAIAEIEFYAAIDLSLNHKVEQKLKSWNVVALAEAKAGSLAKYTYSNLMFSCSFCGVYTVFKGFRTIVVLNQDLTIIGIQLNLVKDFDVVNLRNFRVLINIPGKKYDLCNDFKKRSFKMIGNSITLACIQPLKGRRIEMQANQSQRKVKERVISNITVYFLPSQKSEQRKLDMKALESRQSNAPESTKKASNAIDGNYETYAKAGTTKVVNAAWWRVDMKTNYYVKGVSIASATDPQEAYNLQHFEVVVLTEDDKEMTCFTYSGVVFGPGDVKDIICGKVLNGRHVMIRKLHHGRLRDELSLAEVQIYIEDEDKVNLRFRRGIFGGQQPKLRKNRTLDAPWKFDPDTGRWFLDAHGKKRLLKQVDYYYMEHTVVALDGLPKTCSRTCRDCHVSNDRITGYGWWQHQFPKRTTISSVEILACDDSIECLRNIVVGVTDEENASLKDLRVCAFNKRCFIDLKHSIESQTSLWLKLRCKYPVTGNYLVIGRTRTPSRALSIAEIKAKDRKNRYVALATLDEIQITKNEPDFVPEEYEIPNTTNEPDFVPEEHEIQNTKNEPGFQYHKEWSQKGLVGIRRPKVKSGGEDELFKPGPNGPHRPWRVDDRGSWYITKKNKRYYLTTPKNLSRIPVYNLPIPELALDDYNKTCSKTCYDCDKPSSKIGMWMHKFPKVQTVSEVHILACIVGTECLGDIVVGISDSEKPDLNSLSVCNENEKCVLEEGVPRWLKLRCKVPVTGKYLLIVRNKKPSQPISISEVRVLDVNGVLVDMKPGETEVPTEPEYPEKRPFVSEPSPPWKVDDRGRWYMTYQKKIYYMRPPKNLKAIQFYFIPAAVAALDGYGATCSKTCLDCDDPASKFGLWSFKFPNVQTVSEVHILACKDGSECLGDVVVGVSDRDDPDPNALSVCSKSHKCVLEEGVPRWLKLRCTAPVTGKYLLIFRNKKPSQPISISEVRVLDVNGVLVDMKPGETEVPTEPDADYDRYYWTDLFRPNPATGPRPPWQVNEYGDWYLVTEVGKYVLKRPKNTNKIGNYHIPVMEVALDGYPNTCAKTCFGCTEDIGSGFGWWHYEFQSATTVFEVQILPCSDGIECLRDVVVGVSDWKTSDINDLKICNENEKCQRGKWTHFRCHHPVSGKHLIIIRKRAPSNWINELSIAEIKVKNPSDVYVDITLKTPTKASAANGNVEQYVPEVGDVNQFAPSYQTNPVWMNPGFPFPGNVWEEINYFYPPSPWNVEHMQPFGGYGFSLFNPFFPFYYRPNPPWRIDEGTHRWYVVHQDTYSTQPMKIYHLKPSEEQKFAVYTLPIPSVALDGYVTTCSKTYRDIGGKSDHGWWSFRFPRVTTVSEVELIACNDGVECLKEILVGVSDLDSPKDFKECAENNVCYSENNVPKWFSLKCKVPVTGNHLVVMRKPVVITTGAISALSIAELRVRDQHGNYVIMDLTHDGMPKINVCPPDSIKSSSEKLEASRGDKKEHFEIEKTMP